MKDTLMIEGLAHCAIYVRDLKRAEAFYCDLLGFEKIYLYQGNTLFVQRGSMIFELIEDGVDHAPANAAEIRHLAMACKHIESVYNYLKENGVAIEDPGLVHLPDFGSHGCTYFLFRGPEGERLEFQEIHTS